MKFIALWEFDSDKLEKVSKLAETRVSTGTAKRHNLMDPHFARANKTGISLNLQSLKRHSERHIVIKSLDSALKDFDPEHETLAKTDTLYESLIYAVSILDLSEYEDFRTRYVAEFEMDVSINLIPTIWTVERFFSFWMRMVFLSVPKKYPQVKARFIEKIKESYPKIRL